MPLFMYYPPNDFWKYGEVLYFGAYTAELWPSSSCWYIPQFGTWECD